MWKGLALISSNSKSHVVCTKFVIFCRGSRASISNTSTTNISLHWPNCSTYIVLKPWWNIAKVGLHKTAGTICPRNFDNVLCFLQLPNSVVRVPGLIVISNYETMPWQKYMPVLYIEQLTISLETCWISLFLVTSITHSFLFFIFILGAREYTYQYSHRLTVGLQHCFEKSIKK